jgi:hypothetical protein|tara:strand:- start:1089 stop:1391 length:303 start_codon:yes stop_codon:yes gene_type:complete
MNLSIGDKVSFNYLKGADKQGDSPMLVDYASKAQQYSGTVQEVRDITANPLSEATLSYGNIKGERSQNLVTVEVDEDGSKAFYDGRMIDVQVSKPEAVTA